VHRFASYKGRLSSFKSWSRRHGDTTAGGSRRQRQNRPSNNSQNGSRPASQLPSCRVQLLQGKERDPKKKSENNFQKQTYKSETLANNKNKIQDNNNKKN
jgi:hypothetical protein